MVELFPFWCLAAHELGVVIQEIIVKESHWQGFIHELYPDIKIRLLSELV